MGTVGTPRKGAKPPPKCQPGCQCGKHKRHVRPEVRGKKLSKEHKEKLRQASLGRPHTEESKRKMRESKRRKVEADSQKFPHTIPDRKPCTKCGKTKPASEFSRKKAKLKTTGEVREYLPPECNECVAKRTKAWRERKRAEGTLKEYLDRWNKDLTPEQREARREYHREYQTIRRREKGIPVRGSYRKYRDSGGGKRVPREPIINFVLEQMEIKHWNRAELARRSGIDPSRLDRILDGKDSDGTKFTQITLGTVDKLLLALDREEMLTILYSE